MALQIIGIGEILWDVFHDGPRFGGAPANYACSAAELARGSRVNMGARVSMVSAVGDDELGREAIASLKQRGVGTSAVQINRFPTGRVDVELNQQGIASYKFATDSAWDHLVFSDELKELSENCDAVCFGTLGQRGRMTGETIRAFVQAVPSSALRILDVNLRQPFYSDELILSSLKLANVLKLNDEELPLIAKLSGCSGSEIEVLQQLIAKYQYRFVALTRGPKGAMIASHNSMSDLPGRTVKVVDTVGAGDAFTASLTLDLLAGKELAIVNHNAIVVASYVCSQSGATMAFSDELHKQLRS